MMMEEGTPITKNHQEQDVSEASSSFGTRKKRIFAASVLFVIVVVAVVVGSVLGVRSKNKSNDNDPLTATGDETLASTINNNNNTEGSGDSPTDPTAAPTAFFYESNAQQLFQFLNQVPDSEFYMVNVLEFRDQAVFQDGRPTNLTGREANDIYGQYVRGVALPSINASIVYLAEIEADVTNGGPTPWHQVAVVRYPSRNLFRQMVFNATFQEMLAYKSAGVRNTIILPTTSNMGLALFPTADNPPFPPTDTDLPLAMVHIIRYNEFAQYKDGDVDADPNRSGVDAVAKYNENAGPVAFPLGVRPAGWYDVGAVVAGPETEWNEVRVNTFPSHATFRALTSNPIWQQGVHHRTAGINKTHAFLTSPILINALNGLK